VRVYPPVSLRLPSAVLPALLKRQLTISRTSAEFMQAYRKDTMELRRTRSGTAVADRSCGDQELIGAGLRISL
ncbi:MAG: hypothetical protein ACREYE_12535, partial [Gammaproteobacteria bacterium]